MNSLITKRRGFWGSLLGVAAGPLVMPRHLIAGSGKTGVNGKIRIGAIGADGTGPTEIRPLSEGPNGKVSMT